MSRWTNLDEMSRQLTAFADGELAEANMTQVLAYLSSHPQAVERVEGQRLLRRVAERCAHRQAGAAPEALRRRVHGLAQMALLSSVA